MDIDKTQTKNERTFSFGLYVPLLLIAFGAVVRIAQYLHYRALFHDEGVLASNVLDHSLKELFLPYGDSMAPGLYMALTKIALNIGGVNEYAARFIPFFGGILLILIFYPITRKLSNGTTATIALAFLVVSKYLIEFSDFVRPYSTDACIAIGLIGLTLYAEEVKPNYGRFILLAIIGAASIWLSYPAIFVLAAIGLVQLTAMILERNFTQIRYFASTWCAWAVSFLLFYLLSIRNIESDADTMFLMKDYYQYANAFMPLPPTSFEDLKWFNFHFIKTFDYPGGLTLPGLAAFAFLLGCFSMFKRNKKYLAYLLLPIAMALLASGLERYPFWARTILWVAPIVYILIAEGISFIGATRKRHESMVALLLLAMLIVVPGVRAIRMIPNPSTHHELNKSLDYFTQHRQPGDLLYIRFGDIDAYRFSQWRYEIPPEGAIVEPDPQGNEEGEAEFFAQHLPQLKENGRVWFTLCYDFPYLAEPFLDMLDEHGTRLDEQHALGASAYLYEFHEQQ